MPAWVLDEAIWEKAKAAAKGRKDYDKQSGASFYAVVTTIYKKMGGRIRRSRLAKSGAGVVSQEVQHRGYTDRAGHYYAPHQQRHLVATGDDESDSVRQYREVESRYRGTPQWMRAPNGKRTRLNERQWVLVRTPNFKRWFGDWEGAPKQASKVLDDNGEPQVLYHGTSADIEAFDLSRLGGNSDHPSAHYGFFFTPDKDLASDFADANGGNVLGVFLNLRNPLHTDAESFEEELDFWRGVKGARHDGDRYERSRKHFEEMRGVVVGWGHDGLIVDGGDTRYPELLHGNFIAFSPGQIKSAIGNSGSFRPDSILLNKAEPSAAQIEAGNYRKRKLRFRGLEISIENEPGSVRSGDGWRTKMRFPYGYILGTRGMDSKERGDGHIDCYVGPDKNAPMAFVVHQRKAGRWSEYDEDKVMLGFRSLSEARRAYLAHYDDRRFLGEITAIPFDEFKKKALSTVSRPRMIKGGG